MEEWKKERFVDEIIKNGKSWSSWIYYSHNAEFWTEENIREYRDFIDIRAIFACTAIAPVYDDIKKCTINFSLDFIREMMGSKEFEELKGDGINKRDALKDYILLMTNSYNYLENPVKYHPEYAELSYYLKLKNKKVVKEYKKMFLDEYIITDPDMEGFWCRTNKDVEKMVR